MRTDKEDDYEGEEEEMAVKKEEKEVKGGLRKGEWK